MRKNRTVTLSAVAAASEVSVSAASLAIRGEEGVSEATRARVLAAAEKLGYRPAVRSRVLRPSTRPVLAVLLNDLSSPYNHDVVSGIEAAAEAAGSSTTLAHGGKDVQRLEQRFFSLASSNPDGMVVISSRLPIDSLEEIASRIPVTVVGRLPYEVPGIDSISNDDASGAAAATEHLLSLGHRRIAFLRSSTRPAAMHRQRGFTRVMHAAGFADPVTVGPTDAEWAIQRIAERRPLSLGQGATTAVVANNDRMALRLVSAALDAGLSLPEDLSVTGYNNSALCTQMRPTLTSIDQPTYDMGGRAFAMVRSRSTGRRDDLHLQMAPSLVARGSTGKAAVEK